jgi:hypothetical protein
MGVEGEQPISNLKIRHWLTFIKSMNQTILLGLLFQRDQLKWTELPERPSAAAMAKKVNSATSSVTAPAHRCRIFQRLFSWTRSCNETAACMAKSTEW